MPWNAPGSPPTPRTEAARGRCGERPGTPAETREPGRVRRPVGYAAGGLARRASTVARQLLRRRFSRAPRAFGWSSHSSEVVEATAPCTTPVVKGASPASSSTSSTWQWLWLGRSSPGQAATRLPRTAVPTGLGHANKLNVEVVSLGGRYARRHGQCASVRRHLPATGRCPHRLSLLGLRCPFADDGAQHREGVLGGGMARCAGAPALRREMCTEGQAWVCASR